MRASLALILSAIPLTASLIAPAEAHSRRWPTEPAAGIVTVESRYTAATISGPVRTTAAGRREVRLPGGTWIECRRSCANTLRQETIDFWYIRNNISSTGDDGPGYLNFSFRY